MQHKNVFQIMLKCGLNQVLASSFLGGGGGGVLSWSHCIVCGPFCWEKKNFIFFDKNILFFVYASTVGFLGQEKLLGTPRVP